MSREVNHDSVEFNRKPWQERSRVRKGQNTEQGATAGTAESVYSAISIKEIGLHQRCKHTEGGGGMRGSGSLVIDAKLG